MQTTASKGVTGAFARQRDAVGVYHDVLFDARTTAIRRIFAASFDTTEGTGAGTVHRRPRPVNEAGIVQTCKQDLDELEPDAGLLPGLEPTPTGQAAATAHLGGEVFPGDAGFEDEEDAGEGLAILQGFSTGRAEATRLGWRQQRLEDLPHFIGDERLGHDSTSERTYGYRPDWRCEKHTNGLFLCLVSSICG